MLFLYFHGSLGVTSSDAGVPGVASFRSCGTQPFAELFQVVRESQAGDEFHALVAELAGDSHAKRAAVGDRKIVAIHAVGQKSLRMHRLVDIKTVPPVRLDRKIDNVPSLRADTDDIKDMGETHAGPLGNVRPALFTRDFGDLATTRVAAEL